MQQLVLALHVVISLILIALILLQQGKGAEAGASFGSGASQTIFGSQGSGSFITRITALFVTLFFVTSLSLGYLMVQHTKPTDLDELLKKVPVEKQEVDVPNASAKKIEDDIPDPLKS
jgi:preprotein translocase subunit SecG